MRVKSLKWLSLIMPLLLSLAIVNVVSSPEPVVFVDPPSVIDEALTAGNTFTVSVDIADVTDLKLAQINMSWDPSMLDFVTAYEGDFLSHEGGPGYLWYGDALLHETTPFWEETRVPSTFPSLISPWKTGSLVTNLDTRYAWCNTPDGADKWGGFGFTPVSQVSGLRVTVVAHLDNVTFPDTERDYLEVQVTNDGGTTWGAVHVASGLGDTNTTIPIDVYYDFAWTPAMLSNFEVRLRYKQVGPTATTLRVNFLTARVTDTLEVESPSLAHDGLYALPATLNYGSSDGTFAVLDWGYNLPSSPTTAPADEPSVITQVDFKMKYSATGGSTDRYRITYYQPIFDPNVPQVLQGWSTAAASLQNYTWANVIEPDDGTWDWAEIDTMEFVVETNKVAGSSTANLYIYEMWIEVHYIRATDWYLPSVALNTLDQTNGWAIAAIDSAPEYIWGATGSGWLCTYEFLVQDYGYTELNIDDPLTKLFDVNIDPITPFTKQNGWFKNKHPGDANGDTFVNALDVGKVNAHWAPAGGAPPWSLGYDRCVDCNDDGWINALDIGVINANWD